MNIGPAVTQISTAAVFSSALGCASSHTVFRFNLLAYYGLTERFLRIYNVLVRFAPGRFACCMQCLNRAPDIWSFQVSNRPHSLGLNALE
jgi:hypothetical protein